MNIMTYYHHNSKIIARSYPLQDGGYIFDEGCAFDEKDPVSGLNYFFVTHHRRCYKKSDLTNEISRLKKKFCDLAISTQEYR